MIAFLGFLLGQLFAILLQTARWVDNTRGWAAYFKDRKHQGRHVADLVVSAVVFLTWLTGLLPQFANLFPSPVPEWVAQLPVTPSGPLMTCVVGFLLCFATRWAGKKWFDAAPPPGDA